jgi:hypothetical protein
LKALEISKAFFVSSSNTIKSMKEEYLHFLWRMRFLPSRNMRLTNGLEIEIIDFGEYNNNESGPDFSHGKAIIEGILWVGSIEFHLNSSDWFRHGHQYDSSYENVILHVVWKQDEEVFNNGRNLPTLLISDYVKKDFSTSYERNQDQKMKLPCSFSLETVNSIFIEKEKEAKLYDRLVRKTAVLRQTEKEGYAQVLYELLATAFGSKVNKESFRELSRQIPVKRLLKMSKNKRVAVICETSGLNFTKKEKQESREIKNGMADWQWKRKGLHPRGFPEIRIKQFAYFIQHFEFDFGFLQLPTPELLRYLEMSFSVAESEVAFSKGFKDLVILNSFVPFLWWLGEMRGDDKWQNRAIELLQALPPEMNHITRLMKSIGFEMHSAYDSQAVMELYNQQCTRKKCLTCAIGTKILNG